jgi:cobyrinic acid a,c-diamide synthase
MQRRIVIAGTGSGVGKTTLTIGLMAAMQRKGLVVQGFKCGPDYIDPTYHSAVTGRISRNLDSWMLPSEVVKETFVRGSQGADLSIIEGVAGLFDGKNPRTNEGSTAEISIITKSPVLLILNCQSTARSAAAVVKGFQTFARGVHIVGVIANKVGSFGHFQLIQEAVEQECQIPVIGYLQRNDQLSIPERHLGLIPSIERGELNSLFDSLAEQITASIDLDRLLDLAIAEPLSVESCLFGPAREGKRVRIAVAKDAAFHFYYPENLELLEVHGAECVYFSPLAGEALPDGVDGLYLGGGFPEEFAEALANQEEVKDSIRMAIEGGLPTLAECGGFMYLADGIVTRDGSYYPMIGIFAGTVRMQSKLAALGYREVWGLPGNFLFAEGQTARGHEFHYSCFEGEEGKDQSAYEVKGRNVMQQEGYLYKNVVAGYTHLHFASQPSIVKAWIKKCREVRMDGEGESHSTHDTRNEF